VATAGILEAVQAGDIAVVRRLLAADPAVVATSDEHHKTALHWAAEHDHADIAAALLAAGADIDARTTWGATPLEWAVTMGSGAVGELLVAHGARGMNLWVAAGLGRIDDVRSYLAAGVTRSDGRPPRDGDAEAGWPPHTALMRGDVVSDAFHIACRTGHTDVVVVLLDHGADVDATGYFGATALHWAAFNGHADTVDRLLDRGADPTRRDDEFDSTPAGWAAERGHTDLAEWLEASAAMRRD
jgi:ankyrin repeat protein